MHENGSITAFGYHEHRSHRMVLDCKLNLVETIWTFRSGRNQVFRVLPDGRADIILRFELQANGRCTQITPVVTGPASRAHTISIPEGTAFLGARLQPGRLRSLGLPASSTNTRIEGSSAVELLNLLATIPNKTVTVSALFAMFKEALVTLSDQSKDGEIGIVAWVLDDIHLSGGRSRISWLASRAAVKDRRLRRLFSRHVGMDPKTYSSVVRFQHAVRLLKRGLTPSQAAAAAGYSDQPHMARQFKRHGGFTPSLVPNVELAWMPSDAEEH